MGNGHFARIFARLKNFPGELLVFKEGRGGGGGGGKIKFQESGPNSRSFLRLLKFQ